MSFQLCALLKSSKQMPLLMTFAKHHTAMQLVVAPRTSGKQHLVQDLHVSSNKLYPDTKPIALPNNVDEIDNSKLACFSPNRSRDILGSVISSQSVSQSSTLSEGSGQQSPSLDPHVGSYDCQGAVSLNSAMQSNVPDPFSSSGKSTHLNMPGGQWSQGEKYIAEDMQNSHYSRVPRQEPGNDGQGTSLSGDAVKCVYSDKTGLLRQYRCLSLNSLFNGNLTTTRPYSSGPLPSENKLSNKDKLKRAVKEYGTTVVVFHVSISLLSLGGCYLAVTSGIDMSGAVQSLGAGSEIAAGAGQFVVAYAVHKVLAPVRIAITLASTPFIVGYLRKVGVLKVPKSSV